jgi:hypothetical protein
MKTGWQLQHVIAVAHPDLQPLREDRRKVRPIAQFQVGGAVFAALGALHASAQVCAIHCSP